MNLQKKAAAPQGHTLNHEQLDELVHRTIHVGENTPAVTNCGDSYLVNFYIESDGKRGQVFAFKLLGDDVYYFKPNHGLLKAKTQQLITMSVPKKNILERKKDSFLIMFYLVQNTQSIKRFWQDEIDEENFTTVRIEAHFDESILVEDRKGRKNSVSEQCRFVELAQVQSGPVIAKTSRNIISANNLHEMNDEEDNGGFFTGREKPEDNTRLTVSRKSSRGSKVSVSKESNKSLKRSDSKRSYQLLTPNPIQPAPCAIEGAVDQSLDTALKIIKKISNMSLVVGPDDTEQTDPPPCPQSIGSAIKEISQTVLPPSSNSVLVDNDSYLRLIVKAPSNFSLADRPSVQVLSSDPSLTQTGKNRKIGKTPTAPALSEISSKNVITLVPTTNSSPNVQFKHQYSLCKPVAKESATSNNVNPTNNEEVDEASTPADNKQSVSNADNAVVYRPILPKPNDDPQQPGGVQKRACKKISLSKVVSGACQQLKSGIVGNRREATATQTEADADEEEAECFHIIPDEDDSDWHFMGCTW